ncbi:hypothetical protein ACRAQ7_06115 [Erythrobacter sp. W53]|uniref:hypothetical protein n=1 Tax=Erythrobacter sp. W53 TaxID=3425947 RepID=UPI003D767D59
MDREQCSEAKSCADCPKANTCPDWHAPFFNGLAETSNVKAAIKRAKISASHVYRLKREDPAFANQWNEALLQGYESLELETLDRLRHGMISDDRKYDIANALRLLGMHRDAVAKHRAFKAHNNEEAVIQAINAKISALRHVEQTAVRTIDLLPSKASEKALEKQEESKHKENKS